MTSPRVCLGENLTSTLDGKLQMQPWSVPRCPVDVIQGSSADGTLTVNTSLPGKLMIEKKASWVNDAPINQQMMIRVIRPARKWLTSNPNAIQFRDRWTYAINEEPAVPIVTSTYNSQMGSAADVGTNSVAEPNPGRQWVWWGADTADEWVDELEPGAELKLWYRCYVWTPPPWSDNANKNSPQHTAFAVGVRLQMWAYPTQGTLVTG